MERRYKAVSDRFSDIFIWGITIMVALCLLSLYIWGHLNAFGVVMLTIIALVVCWFLLNIWYNTYYVFHKDYLCVSMGWLTTHVAYKDVSYVRAVEVRTSSMALSADCVEIWLGEFDYDDAEARRTNVLYVSPENRDKFIGELMSLCPRVTSDKVYSVTQK